MTARNRPDLPRRLLPDPLLARRALSEMRNAVRQGFALVRDGLDQAPLPAPVAALTGSVLRKVDGLAQHADAVARTVADGFLGPQPSGSPLGDALREAIAELDAPLLRVSEAAVREACAGRVPVETAEAAAMLVRRLLEAGAVQPAGREASVAVFAAVLARLQGPGDTVGLSSSVPIAVAIADEIVAAGAATGPLARLFAEFRDHV